MFKFKYVPPPPASEGTVLLRLETPTVRRVSTGSTYLETTSLSGGGGGQDEDLGSIVSEDSGTASIALTVASSSQYSPATLPKASSNHKGQKGRRKRSVRRSKSGQKIHPFG